MKACLYCAKCDKSIPKDGLEERSRRLKAEFGDSSLEMGRCPVCGTMLIDMDRIEESRRK